MKSLFRMIIVLTLVLSCAFALSSCEMLNGILANIPGFSEGDTSGGENEGEGNEDEGKGDEGSKELEGLVLIQNGKANFRIVFSTDAGPSAINKIDTLVKKLRSLGVEIEDPIRANETGSISDCEILVGPGITNRGEECNVNEKDYGEKGYVIKTVGNRIVIAGGNKTMTATAFDTFAKTYLKVTDKTKEIGDINFTESILVEKFTEYMIKGITVGGADLSEFVIVKDLDGMADYGDEFVTNFREELYTESGYWLEIIDSTQTSDKAHKLIIRYTAGAIEGDTDGMGFLASVKGGDLVFECSYANALTKFFEKTVDALIFSKMNEITISDKYSKFEEASAAYYKDFGAVGNGKVDDFKALLETHKYANECGQTVKGTEGATYYVDRDFTETIPVYTNIDLQGATILINDDSEIAHEKRGLALFTLTRKTGIGQWINNEERIATMFASYEKKITRDATELPFLVPYLKGDSYVIVINANHLDFIRFGSNQSDGNVRTDMFLVDKDGKIQPGYEPAFEFDDITTVKIFDASEAELVIENGSIKNICCTVKAATGLKNKYVSYARGITVNRSNVVIRNIDFRTVNEPIIDFTYDEKDPLTTRYGKRAESYPYGGFIIGTEAYNLLVQDCTMSARTTYYEDKPATESTGGQVPDPVAMGSYGYTYSYSSAVKHVNVDQHCETGIGDSRYWGIMNSNTCKNFHFEDCEVNRFDAHRGFWNGNLINSTFGHTINLTGGGDFYAEGVEKLCGTAFINLRGDYGGSFDGTVTIKDSIYYGYDSYNSFKNGSFNTTVTQQDSQIINSGFAFSQIELFLDWDFGYPCTLPHKVTLDNFTCMPGSCTVYNNLPDECFENERNLQLGLTDEIVFKNMKRIIPTCVSQSGTMSKIKVTVQ